ncbi:hypothetical protein J7K44_01060 [bacterium]|nr:hypothetical protein [bacterium]
MEKEDLLEQYTLIQKVLVEGIKRVRQGLLEVKSAIAGAKILDPSVKINTEDLFWCDNAIRRLGTQAVAELVAAGRRAKLPLPEDEVARPIKEFMEVPSVLR